MPADNAAYSPEGHPACPFCGQETSERISEIMLASHEAIEKLISVEPGSDEFWQARAEVVNFVGG